MRCRDRRNEGNADVLHDARCRRNGCAHDVRAARDAAQAHDRADDEFPSVAVLGVRIARGVREREKDPHARDIRDALRFVLKPPRLRTSQGGAGHIRARHRVADDIRPVESRAQRSFYRQRPQFVRIVRKVL